MEALWTQLAEFLLVLATAFAFGAGAQRLRQSPILGYLLAGALLGPLLLHAKLIAGLAELGVALLLFSIGLEFSLSRLRRFGAAATGGGALQIALTLSGFALLALPFRPGREAVVLGAIAALSSTAVTARVLADRAELDSVHGRSALGVLLAQDVAVVPLVVLLSVLAGGGGAAAAAPHLAKTVAALAALAAAFYLVFYLAAPRLLGRRDIAGRRELTHLLTLVAALGSAWAAHALGLSPSLGAFVAGALLGESEFAVQIRADIGPVRTLFVTLFFTSIGMLADPRWMFFHLPLLLGALAVVVAGKAALGYAALRPFRVRPVDALAAGLCLAQIGEFSFVLATSAAADGLLSDEALRFVSSLTILSLFAAPYLIARARSAASRVVRRLSPTTAIQPAAASAAPTAAAPVLLIGFGPAGRQVAEALRAQGVSLVLIEQNPETAGAARAEGFAAHSGDAAQSLVLEHAGAALARLVVVTVPDPRASQAIVRGVRALAPAAGLLVRARYSILRNELHAAGASTVVDEETEVGRRLAEQALRFIHAEDAGA